MGDNKALQDKGKSTQDIVININVKVNGLEEMEDVIKMFNDLKNMKRNPNICV